MMEDSTTGVSLNADDNHFRALKEKEKSFVSIREAAEKIYGCTTQNLYKQIRRGNLKVYERFGHRVVSVEEVKELADFISPRGGDRKFIPKKSEKR